MKTFILMAYLLAVTGGWAADPGHPDALAWRNLGVKAENELADMHHAEAAELADKALRIAKRFGPTDTRVASTHYLLGLINRDWGRCADSRTHYLTAISIWKKQPVPDTAKIFRAASGLVSVNAECHDFAGAEKAYRTFKADLHRGGQEPLDQALLLGIEATLMRGRKDYAQSEQLFQRAIDILERTPGSSKGEIMILHNSRSVALNRLGRWEEALAEAQLAAQFFENSRALHPSYIAALNNGACALAALHRREESERMFEKALAAAKDVYGEDNHIAGQIMLNYSRVLRENKEGSSAAIWKKRGQEAYQRSLVKNSQSVDVRELQMR